jgi:hypothetical protein
MGTTTPTLQRCLGRALAVNRPGILFDLLSVERFTAALHQQMGTARALSCPLMFASLSASTSFMRPVLTSAFAMQMRAFRQSQSAYLACVECVKLLDWQRHGRGFWPSLPDNFQVGQAEANHLDSAQLIEYAFIDGMGMTTMPVGFLCLLTSCTVRFDTRESFVSFLDRLLWCIFNDHFMHGFSDKCHHVANAFTSCACGTMASTRQTHPKHSLAGDTLLLTIFSADIISRQLQFDDGLHRALSRPCPSNTRS